MNQKEARKLGRATGIEYARQILPHLEETPSVDALTRDVLEMEENARQYTEGSFLCAELNSARNPDAAWTAYEEGIAVGVRFAYQQATKRRPVYIVQGKYSARWEDVTAEHDRSEARARLQEYRENEPNTPRRLITRMERP